MVLAEQLDTCDKTCVIRYLGKVSKGQMRGIDEAVKVIIANNLPILNDVEFQSWLFSSFGKSDCYLSALHDVQTLQYTPEVQIRYLGKVSKGQMRGIDEAVKVQLGYYIPEQAEKKRQGKCRKEVNFDGG